jgi:hypothetical protein
VANKKRIRDCDVISHQSTAKDWKEIELIEVLLPLSKMRSHLFVRLSNYKFVGAIMEASAKYKEKMIHFRVIPNANTLKWRAFDLDSQSYYWLEIPELELAILESETGKNGRRIKLNGQEGVSNSIFAMGCTAFNGSVAFDFDLYNNSTELKEMMVSSYRKMFQCKKEAAIAKAKEFLVKEIQND